MPQEKLLQFYESLIMPDAILFDIERGELYLGTAIKYNDNKRFNPSTIKVLKNNQICSYTEIYMP